jgi:hypothetical protein
VQSRLKSDSLLDPARAQAKRLIETFEAYGIARQQIPRLLPPELKLHNAAFSTPDKLKDNVTPELLDWAADHLAFSRPWLDRVADTPHLMVDHYKACSSGLTRVRWLEFIRRQPPL